MQDSASCVKAGGCATDYVVATFTFISCILIFLSVCFVIVKRKTLERNFNKKISLLLIQAAASLMFLSGDLLSMSILRLRRHHFWTKCHLWKVWIVGPFGFGLLFSCLIAQVYRLYYVFQTRRLQPLTYYQLLLVLLSPWFVLAAVAQFQGNALNEQDCSYKHVYWKILIKCMQACYAIILVYGAWKIRNINFQFHEFTDLLKAVIVCSILLATLASLAVAEQVTKSHKAAISVTCRFIILLTDNAAVILLYWFPMSRPLCLLAKGREKKYRDFSTMGQALGVPYSGFVTPGASSFDFSKPLECLLESKQFRKSYLAFADSRMAGEVVHFYAEVRELNKISEDNPVQRVYLVEHIIDKYIKTGSAMEINISHQMRSQIMNTKDLADPDLFKRAVNESLKMMQMNLTNEYWKSAHFDELKAELDADAAAGEGLEPIEETKLDIVEDNPFDPGSISERVTKRV